MHMAFVSEGHHRFCIVTSITITTIVIQSKFCSDTCCLCSEAATDFFFRYGPSWARGRGVQRGGVLRTSRLDRAAPWGLRSAKLSAKLSPSVPRCPCAPITVLGHAPLPLCPPLHPSVALWARDVTLVSFGHFGHHGSEVHGARDLLGAGWAMARLRVVQASY